MILPILLIAFAVPPVKVRSFLPGEESPLSNQVRSRWEMSLILVWAPRLPFLTPQLLHDTALFPSPWLAPFLSWQGSSETFYIWSQNMGESTRLCCSCLDQNAHKRLYLVHEHMQGAPATNWHCIYRTKEEPLCYSPTNKAPQRHCSFSTGCSALQTFSIYTPALASIETSLVKEHLQTQENKSIPICLKSDIAWVSLQTFALSPSF